MNRGEKRIVVAIPCFNEAKTIREVIRGFKRELPQAEIIVFDNNSTDNTPYLAKKEGVEVVKVKRRGKGYIIQRIFEGVEADIYVLVDGDNTYSPADVHRIIKPLLEDEADMVIGRRIYVDKGAMRGLNKIGNIFFSQLLNFFFKMRLSDVLSGYRALTRECIQGIPVIRFKFEIETEITIQALTKGFRVKEVPISYRERIGGSHSKLSPFKDGYSIFLTILSLFRDLKPLTFFGTLSVFIWIGALSYGLKVYYAERFASLLDTIILTSLFIIGWLFLLIGISIHTINRRFTELTVLLRRMKR